MTHASSQSKMLGQHLSADRRQVVDEKMPAAMFFVLSPDMVVTHASENGDSWLTSFRRRWLEGLLHASSAVLEDGIRTTWDGFEVHARFLGALGSGQQKWGCCVVTVETVQTDTRLGLLTPRERQVAEYATYGSTNSEIARGLGIGMETVKTHLRQIFLKLEVCNRVELARFFGGTFT